MFKKGDILIAKTSSIYIHHNKLTIGNEYEIKHIYNEINNSYQTAGNVLGPQSKLIILDNTLKA